MGIKRYILATVLSFMLVITWSAFVGVGRAEAAYVFHSGFEIGDFSEWSSVTGSPSVQGGIKKTGDYSMRCDTSGTGAYVTFTADPERRVSFYMYVASLPDGETIIVRRNASLFGNLRLSTDGYLKLYSVDTWRGTGSTQLETETWYRIGLNKTDLNHAMVYLDGEVEIAEKNVTPGEFNIVGVCNSVITDIYFDDIIFDDIDSSDDLGDIRVLRSSPDDDGTNTDFDTVAPTQGRPWYDTVDETYPVDDADYTEMDANSTDAEDTYDLVECSTLGLGGSDTIEAVSVWVRMQRGGGKSSVHQIVVYDGGNYEYAWANGTSFAWFSEYFADKPSTGSWTQGDFDAFEAGGGNDGSGNQNTLVSCVQVMVAYMPPTGCVPDITNAPTSKGFGVVDTSSTYWSNGSEPTWPLVDGDAYFTVTNNSGGSIDINIKATNFTGGVGWTLAGTPGENIVVLSVFEEGDGSGDGLTLTTSDQLFINSLADSGDKDWELKFQTATSHTDGDGKASTITLTAVCE